MDTGGTGWDDHTRRGTQRHGQFYRGSSQVQSWGLPSSRARGNYSRDRGPRIEGRDLTYGHATSHFGPQTHRDRGRGRSGSHTGRGAHTSVRPPSLWTLTDALRTNPRIALINVVAPHFGLQECFDQEQLPNDIMKVLLKLLVHCLHATMHQNCISLLSLVHQSHVFITSIVSFILGSFCSEADLLNVIEICQSSLQYIPGPSVPKTTVLLSQVNAVIMRDFEVNQELVEKLREVEEMKTIVVRGKKPANAAAAYDFEDDLDPQEDFRSLPITPTLADLMTDELPFLRKNKTTGGYRSIEHYLDVQFRLLREEFISPLRNGIQELLKSKELGNQTRLNYQGDIRLYKNVCIDMPLCGRNGIVYRLTFGVASLKKVNWEYSKRLITGSLLCMSADNFQTIVFAIVRGRDPVQLSRGHILIELDDHSVELNDATEYEMVESTAYFEAYKHNLKRIQEIEELPFKDYLLKADVDDVMAPKYLRKPEAALILSSKEYPALKVAKWPEKEVLELNESQFSAFQNALTKEFSIIQGPPGTGKTYLGLKVIETLLNNQKTWRKDKQGCILIVCYTNHALDQFLEGILSQSALEPGQLVRIGGKSKSEEVQKFNIAARRNVVERSWVVGRGIREMREQQDMLKSEIAWQHSDFAIAKSILHSIQDLEFAMTSQQFNSMKARSHFRCVVTSWLLLEDKQHSQQHKAMANIGAGDYNDDVPEFQFTEKPERRHLRDNDDDKDLYSVADMQDRMVENAIQESYPVNDSQDGFQTVNKKRNKKIRSLLKYLAKEHRASMDYEEANAITNVWALDQHGRFRLYRSWLNQLYNTVGIGIDLKPKIAKYNALADRIREAYSIHHSDILEGALVVGLTTTGAAKHTSMMSQLKPTITIIEEAAEVLEAHISTLLSSRCEHLILIGDHQQLRPNPAVYRLARKYNLDVSLFERMVKSGMCCSQLDMQHRMRPEIAKLITPHIYKKLFNHPSVLDRDNILGISGNVFFINHHELESTVEDTMSRSNKHEALYITRLIRYFLHQGYQASQITVLTMYLGQMFLIKKRMTIDLEKDEMVRVTPVDNFQGEENDIILLSCVRSNADDKIGFLNVSSRVCVALSRARKGFYCIGNISLLRKVNPLWEKICCELDKDGNVVDGLPCACQNHPDYKFVARFPSDFDKAPLGGCTLPCTFRLGCGHTCQLLCHPFDKKHVEYKCNKPCIKSCPIGHPCTYPCYMVCPPCKKLVAEIIPKCGHEQMVPCYMNPEEFTCRVLCNREKPCGHICIRACGDGCLPCHQPVVKTLPNCGHEQKVLCAEKIETVCLSTFLNSPNNTVAIETVKCTSPCITVIPNRQWPCGHKLSLACWQNPENTTCSVKVAKKRSCGHIQEVGCADNPETEPCRSTITVQCTEVATHSYSTSCGGDRRCTMPCCHVLQCGHKCPGKCGVCEEDNHLACCRSTCTQNLLSDLQRQGKWGEPCSPCSIEYQGGCSHLSCNESRGIYFSCWKPCEWSCQHVRCDLSCWDPCKRPPCDYPCPKYLSCGHQCSGLCGEECPPVCKICHAGYYQQITHGRKEMLIILDPCRHVFPVQQLDAHFKLKKLPGSHQQVQKPSCPACRRAVKVCNRYNSIIKQAALDLSRVNMMATLKKPRISFKPSLEAGRQEEFKTLVDDYLTERVDSIIKFQHNYRDLQSLRANLRSLDEQIESFYQISAGQVDIWKEVLKHLRGHIDKPKKSSIWIKCPDGHIRLSDPKSWSDQCPDCLIVQKYSLQEIIRRRLVMPPIPEASSEDILKDSFPLEDLRGLEEGLEEEDSGDSDEGLEEEDSEDSDEGWRNNNRIF